MRERKKFIGLLFVIVHFLLSCGGKIHSYGKKSDKGIDVQNLYASGSGTKASPYIISSEIHLQNLAEKGCSTASNRDCDKYFKLAENLDLSLLPNIQIGTSSNPFSGVFDGNGKVIKNYTYEGELSKEGNGFFSFIDYGEVKNLGLENVSITSNGNKTGALAGQIHKSRISNCFVNGGNVNTSSSYIGGLIGYSSYSTVSQTSSNVNVGSTYSGFVGAGGIVGYNSCGLVSQSFSSGITSGCSVIGGIVGGNDSNLICYSVVSYSYSSGDVVAVDDGNWWCGGDSGGLVGYNTAIVTDSYTTSSLTCGVECGGCSRTAGSGENYNCYHHIDTLASGGKTTEELQDIATFIGWDFVGDSSGNADIWVLNENSYPSLWFESDDYLAPPSFSGGSGSLDDPYIIETSLDLININRNPRVMESYFKLSENIDMSFYDGSTSEKTFKPIGDTGLPFEGNIDGNGKIISNLFISSTLSMHVGLISVLLGNVENLGLSNVDITILNQSGGLVGLNVGNIKNSFVTGTVSGGTYIGLLAGENQGSILESYSTGSISGSSNTGGFVGINYGSIERSLSHAEVLGSGHNIGGFAGYNSLSANVKIENSYATGNVHGNRRVGGFIGYLSGIVKNCYQTGVVTDDVSESGGFAGYANSPVSQSSYFNIETGGIIDAIDGIGKTQAELKIKSTFIDWDFTSVWTIDEGNDYPKLLWE